MTDGLVIKKKNPRGYKNVIIVKSTKNDRRPTTVIRTPSAHALLENVPSHTYTPNNETGRASSPGSLWLAIIDSPSTAREAAFLGGTHASYSPLGCSRCILPPSPRAVLRVALEASTRLQSLKCVQCQ